MSKFEGSTFDEILKIRKKIYDELVRVYKSHRTNVNFDIFDIYFVFLSVVSYGKLDHLLMEESYSKITVQQLIDRADIGRTTFYSHFETKDELLEALCKEIFDHVFADDLNKESNHDFSNTHTIESKVTHILYHLQEHMDYLPGILSGESDDIFMSYFKKYLAELFLPATENCSSTIPGDYILHHMVSDFAETVRWWTANNNYSPEQISSFFFGTTPLP